MAEQPEDAELVVSDLPVNLPGVEDDEPPPEGDGTDKMTAKEYKKWLQTQCTEWAADEEKKEGWATICTSKFQKVPQTNHMSVDEMESTLIAAGHTEVEATKEGTEKMYDGVVTRFMRDNDGQAFAAFIVAKDFGDQQVYCHKVHIDYIRVGDTVRFAVHFNEKKQPQVSFIDRLNNRAQHPRGERTGAGKKGKGKGKGSYQTGGYGSSMLVQLADGTVLYGTPVGTKGKGKGHFYPSYAQVPSWTRNRGNSKPPEPGKPVYCGQIARKNGDNGFIKCPETEALYGRDVYMWKTYFKQCQVGDWVKFNVHVSEKGLPQVSWLDILPIQNGYSPHWHYPTKRTNGPKA